MALQKRQRQSERASEALYILSLNYAVQSSFVHMWQKFIFVVDFLGSVGRRDGNRFRSRKVQPIARLGILSYIWVFFYRSICPHSPSVIARANGRKTLSMASRKSDYIHTNVQLHSHLIRMYETYNESAFVEFGTDAKKWGRQTRFDSCQRIKSEKEDAIKNNKPNAINRRRVTKKKKKNNPKI